MPEILRGDFDSRCEICNALIVLAQFQIGLSSPVTWFGKETGVVPLLIELNGLREVLQGDSNDRANTTIPNDPADAR